MKIKISGKNEFKIVPDIMDNLEKEPKDQFAVWIKKLSQLETSTWATADKNGMISVNMRKRMEAAIIRLENPPILEIEGGKEEMLTIEILISDKYQELYELQEFISLEISDLNEGIDKKK